MLVNAKWSFHLTQVTSSLISYLYLIYLPPSFLAWLIDWLIDRLISHSSENSFPRHLGRNWAHAQLYICVFLVQQNCVSLSCRIWSETRLRRWWRRWSLCGDVSQTRTSSEFGDILLARTFYSTVQFVLTAFQALSYFHGRKDGLIDD